MNVKWHSDPWPTVTSVPIRMSTNFMTLITSLTFTELWGVSMEHLQQVMHASRERLFFRIPGSVDFLVLHMLRPDSSNMPRLYSTFPLEYSLVISRFCFLVEDIGKLFRAKVLLDSIQWLKIRQTCLANQRPGLSYWFSIGPKKDTLGKAWWDLQLHVKFRRIPFRGCRETINASANKKPRRQCWISDRPEKQNLVKDVEILLLVKFRPNQCSPCREMVENVSHNQRPGQSGYLVFQSARKKHKLSRGR